MRLAIALVECESVAMRAAACCRLKQAKADRASEACELNRAVDNRVPAISIGSVAERKCMDVCATSVLHRFV